MAVQLFTDGIEPEDIDVPVWRFLDQQKFEDLLRTGELFFNRRTALSRTIKRVCHLRSTCRVCASTGTTSGTPWS